MKRALLLVDYIHDFVDDDGALTVGHPAQAIRENIERAISRMNKSDLIVLANDSHDWSAPHPEKKLFPPHALAGTRGAETAVSEALKKALKSAKDNETILRIGAQGMDPASDVLRDIT